MRRVIAERLVNSKQTVPHFYLTVEIQMDEVLHLRKVLNESSATKISVNDLIVKVKDKNNSFLLQFIHLSSIVNF